MNPPSRERDRRRLLLFPRPFGSVITGGKVSHVTLARRGAESARRWWHRQGLRVEAPNKSRSQAVPNGDEDVSHGPEHVCPVLHELVKRQPVVAVHGAKRIVA